MNIQYLRLERFRNHTHDSIGFGGGINVLLGENGHGKTNVLEAISCLGLTKSFSTANDATLIQLGCDMFEVEGSLVSDTEIEYIVSLAYEKESGEKTFTVNGERIDRLTSIIGMFPMVVLSPQHGAITLGGPADRRRFTDLLLSQLSRTYFEDVLEYRQILRQRNRILAEAKQRGVVREDVLVPWDHNLAKYGARIVHKRMSFLAEFNRYVEAAYAGLVETKEVPSVHYVTAPETSLQASIENIAENILDEVKKKQAEECRRGLSLVGPHRDDLLLQLNGIDMQKYASQGQHKTFLIALKLAEFFYMREKRGETPMLLLDDILSELDDIRSRRLLRHIVELGQTFITTTNASPFSEIIQWGHANKGFYVEQGTCKSITISNGKEAAVGA